MATSSKDEVTNDFFAVEEEMIYYIYRVFEFFYIDTCMFKADDQLKPFPLIYQIFHHWKPSLFVLIF